MTYHLGVSAATASFYAGQSRPAFRDYIGVNDDRVAQLQAMGVLNFEMESATVFTLSSLFGLRGGAACIVVADRFRNEFRPEGADEVLAQLGAEASVALAGMDSVKRQAGRTWYYPSLGRAEA
jgi:uridine phosphorylase